MLVGDIAGYVIGEGGTKFFLAPTARVTDSSVSVGAQSEVIALISISPPANISNRISQSGRECL